MDLKVRFENKTYELHVFAGEESTVETLKVLVEELCGIEAEQQRVVHRGAVLKVDGVTLADAGVHEGDTIYIVRGRRFRDKASGKSAASTASTAISSSAPTSPIGTSASAGAGASGSPGAGMTLSQADQLRRQNGIGAQMSAMMNNPLMRSLMGNTEFVRSIISQDPRIQRMIEENPQFAEAVRSDAFIRQISEAMQDPSAMEAMTRDNDRALAFVESLPGGMGLLSQMHHSMEQFTQTDDVHVAETTDEATRRQAAELAASENPTAVPLPNPWANNNNNNNNNSQAAPNPFGFGGMGLNAGGATGGATANPFAAMFGAGANPPPGTPPGAGSSASGHPLLSSMFGGASPVASATPSVSQMGAEQRAQWESRYANELSQLGDMGFTDADAALDALLATNGNVMAAVDRLVQTRRDG